jgi:sarcosine oxidase subunit alpha
MPEPAAREAPGVVRLRVDGKVVEVPPGSTVAAVLAGRRPGFRRSVRGDLRGPLCGMGICFECRATVDGRLHVRTCMILCRDGMEVETDA